MPNNRIVSPFAPKEPPKNEAVYDLVHHAIECVIVIRCRCTRPEPILVIRSPYAQVQCPTCHAAYRLMNISFDAPTFIAEQTAMGVAPKDIDFDKVPTRLMLNRADPLIHTPPS